MTDSDEMYAAVAAIRLGRPVVLPTDTVYGLCATPYRAEPVERLYRLKGRVLHQPTAILASDVDMLFECVPELRGKAGTIVRALLPGPYTLVLPNPARRYRWLTGSNPDTIGVRVPELPEPAARVLSLVGAVAATSANAPGGRDPRRLEDVPEEIRSKAVVLDGGELPGVASTVIDFSGAEPKVLRDGAAPAADALEAVRAALV
ncbi:MAG TPA: L-threonylcarbamoyladenylate synthase [Gaiellaceae bacterium]|nr:L-threonylcarbamoyladenylate synthase [Gaiellaceae bacterium]